MLYFAICCYFFCTGNERSSEKADHVAGNEASEGDGQ